MSWQDIIGTASFFNSTLETVTPTLVGLVLSNVTEIQGNSTGPALISIFEETC